MDELQEGIEAGYSIISPSWLHVDPIKTPLTSWMTSTLDKGEAAVIQLALEKNIQSVCIDEWKGRRAAIVAGLKVTGVLGLLGRAKKLGIVDAVRPFINKTLDEGIRYHSDLVQRVLNALDE